MKITFFEVPKEEQSIFASFFADHEVSFYEDELKEENISLIKDTEIVSVFVNSVINKDIIESLPNLKFITTRSTGFDHIDIEYCNTKGIKVSNVPGYGSSTVAEFAFALLLTLSRKVNDAYHNLREGADFNIFSLKGFDLKGKTIGIIGTGRIGKNMIKMAKGFSMNVVAYDLFPDIAFAKENDFSYKNFDELISESDIISIHAPYNKDNHHLINKDVVSKMKKGVYIINTSRGELIDTEALLFGLKENIVAGAGLDVLEGERDLREEVEIVSSKSNIERVKDYKLLLEDRILIDMPNVIVTPHIAFYSKEAEEEIIHTTIENIKGFLSDIFINLINTKK